MSFFKNYLNELKQLQKLGATIFCIGYSFLGRPIFCVNINGGKKKLLLQYAIHAREYITYHLAILQIKQLLKKKPNGDVFFIPISNPDGVCLSVDGLKSIDNLNEDLKLSKNFMPFCVEQKPKSKLFLNNIKKNLLKINNNKKNFCLWKSNARGVDLNTNFDAKWSTGKQNTFIPASENCVGKKPESEPETKSLACFLKILKPDMTISYHSKGEVIFYDFFQPKSQKLRDKKIAKEISKITCYKIKKTGKSSGGFKDFCIQNLKIPALTIEVGKNSLFHPIGKKHLLHIYSQNKKVIEKSLALLNQFNI